MSIRRTLELFQTQRKHSVMRCVEHTHIYIHDIYGLSGTHRKHLELNQTNECRTWMRLKSCGFESRQEQRENFLLQGQISVLTLISVSVPLPCYCSNTQKIPVILPVHLPWYNRNGWLGIKHQVTTITASASGRLQLSVHARYVCGFAWSDMTWWMVVWCT